MAADGLTKLASSTVLDMLRDAMDAQPPDIASADSNFKSEEATWWAALIRAHKVLFHGPKGQGRLCVSRAPGGLQTIEECDMDNHSGHLKTEREDADILHRNQSIWEDDGFNIDEQAKQPVGQSASPQPALRAVEILGPE